MNVNSTTSLVNFKKILLGCAIGGSVAFGGAASIGLITSNAMAQGSAMNLQPVSGWAVSKVGDVSSGAGYCALARRFTNSHVVTIAQNKESEASFAFDFQRTNFSVNSSYNVKLVSGDYKKSFDVMAKTESGLVLKVGRDKNLFSALEKTQKLTISVNDQNYDFAFNGFKAGLEQLEQCLGFSEQKVRAQYSGQIGELRGQMGELRDELQMLQSENQSLLSQLEGERSKFRSEIAQKTKENSQIDSLMNKLTSLENNNTQLMQKLQSEQSANTGLQSNLDKIIAEKQMIKTSADEGVKMAVAAAQKEREELRAMLNAEKTRRAEIEKIVAQKDNVEKQQSELIARISELEELNADLGVSLGKEEAERRKIEAQLQKNATSSAEYNKILNENKTLKQNLEQQRQAASMGQDTSRRVDELSEKLALQQNLVSQKDKEAEAARQSLFETQARFERLKIERENLMSMLERERAEFAKYMKQEGGDNSQAMRELTEKLSMLENKNATLMRELQDSEENVAVKQSTNSSIEAEEKLALQNRHATATESEVAELKKMLAMERDERMRLARALTVGKGGDSSESAPTREAFAELAQSFQKRIAQIEAENSRLKSDLQLAVAKPNAAVNKSISAQELQEARMMIAQKAQELDVVSAERDELKSLLGQERARRIKMAQMLDQKKDVTTQKTELNSALRALEARNMELARALENAKKNAAKATADGAINVGEVVARPPLTTSASGALSNNQEIAEIKNDLEIAMAERDEYRNLLQEERARLREVQSLRARIGSVNEDQASLNGTIEALRREKIELQRALQAEKERLQAQPQVAKVETKIVTDPKAQEEIEVLRAERDALRKKVIHDSKGTQEEVSLLETMVEQAQKDESDMRARIAKLEQEKQELNSLLGNAQREAAKARSEVSSYTDQNKQIPTAKLQASNNDDQRLAALEEENRRLYTEMQALKAQKSEVESMDAELSSLKAQNTILREEITDRKQGAGKVVADEDMVAHLRGTIERLSLQNENLQEALAFSKDREAQTSSENPYREKLLNAETRIQAVMAENASLARELEKERLDAEKSLISTDNVDLDTEKATARYKEAEREIDRLSRVLKEERAKHQEEVASLEEKLFDPAITEAEQIKKMRDMKREIARLQNIEPAAGGSDSRFVPEFIDPNTPANQEPIALDGSHDTPDMISYNNGAKNIDKYSRSGIKIEVEADDISRMPAEPVAEVKAIEPNVTRSKDIDFVTEKPQTAKAQAQVQAEDTGAYQSSVARLRNRIARNTDDEEVASYASSRHYEASVDFVDNTGEGTVVPKAPRVSPYSGNIDFEPVPQAQAPVVSKAQPKASQQMLQPENVAAVEPAAGVSMPGIINEAPAARPVVMNVDKIPQGAVASSNVAPIMDGPGEAQLASAVQNGGGVFVSERQVVIQPEAPKQVPQQVVMPQQVAMAPVAPIQAQSQMTIAQPNVIYQMQPMAEPVRQPQYQQPAAVAAPMQMASAVTSQAVMPRPQAPVQQAPQNAGPDGQDIASLLIKAGVPMVSGFEKVSSVSNARFAAFRWDTGSVYGSAEKTYMPDMSQFQNFVDGYLRKTEARCTGSFDKTSNGMRYIGSKAVISYDIACVGGDMQGAGAALLFYSENNMFNVIAHESGIEGLDQAMNTRDTLSSVLSQ